jgi:hypothetical protein
MEETSRVSAGAELVHTVEIGAAGRQGAWRRPLFEELASVHERSALYGQYFAKSGVKELDVALGGGLRPGQYIELRGRSGTGKSLLCNSVLSRNIHTFRIVYLDSENNHQCVDLVQTRLPQISSSSYYQLFPVFCIEDVLDVLRQTEAEEERRLCHFTMHGHSGTSLQPLLLIFDAVSGFVAAATGTDPDPLIETGLRLRSLACIYNAIVLVSNSMPIMPWISRCAPMPPCGIIIETGPALRVNTGNEPIVVGSLRGPQPTCGAQRREVSLHMLEHNGKDQDS